MGYVAQPTAVAVGKDKDGNQKFNIYLSYIFDASNPPTQNINVGGLTLLECAFIDLNLSALKIPANLPPIKAFRFNVLYGTTAAAPAGAVLVANNSGDLVIIPYDAAYDDASTAGQIPVSTGLVPFHSPINSVIRIAAVPPNVVNPTQTYQTVQLCFMTYDEPSYFYSGKSSITLA